MAGSDRHGVQRDCRLLYGVETKRVNEAVKNNPEKFLLGYMLQLTSDESGWPHGKYQQKAFTKKVWSQSRRFG